MAGGDDSKNAGEAGRKAAGKAQQTAQQIRDSGAAKVATDVKQAVKGLGAGDLQTSINEALGSTKELIGGFKSLFDGVSVFRNEMSEFFKSGYTDQMDKFANSISSANDASYKLFGNFKEGIAVTKAFRDQFTAMPFVSEKFSESLMKNSVVLSGAGFEMNSFAQIMQEGVMAFNMSEDSLNKMTAQLVHTTKEFAIAPDILTDNFRIAQKDFAYTSDKFMDNFVKLQKMARTTGVDFQSLAGAFGSSMDTFQGSAQKAGQLNQILGTSVFNSIDLLNKTEAERAETIRNEITKSGRNVEEMGKFELLALKDTLGLGSVAETRKFLRGDLKMDKTGEFKKMQETSPDKIINKRGKDLGNAIAGLSKGIKNQQGPMTRAMIELNNSIRDNAKRIGIFGPTHKGLQDKMVSEQFVPHMLARALGAKGDFDKSLVAGVDITNLQKTSRFLAKTISAAEKAKGIGDLVTIQLANIEMMKFFAGKIPGMDKDLAGKMAMFFGKEAAEVLGRLLGLTPVSKTNPSSAIVPNAQAGGK